MILAEFVMACFTSIPNMFMTIYSLATASMVKPQLRTAQDSLWFNVFTIFTMSTYCGSFYVYLIASSAYRHNVRVALNCKRENYIGTQNNILLRINTIDLHR